MKQKMMILRDAIANAAMQNPDKAFTVVKVPNAGIVVGIRLPFTALRFGIGFPKLWR